MKALTTFASAVVLAATLAVSAVPAHATVFADFTPDTNANDYKWVNNGALDTGTGGHFFSITNVAQTTAHGVATHFSFLDPTLSALAFIPATFTIDATVASGNPATNLGPLYTRTNLTGNFSFIYTGATINNYLGSGINLVHNSNLLSGVFTDAWIQGAGGSGSTNLAIGNGGSASYNSDYEQFANLANNSEEFAFNLLSVTPNFGAKPGAAMTHFVSNGGGNFSFQGVPEPATWGLMIMGFGGVGALVRNNRRRMAVATA